ncbi:MAG: hypothetical protein WC955_07240 [Elusimicrobiota bacterium]
MKTLLIITGAGASNDLLLNKYKTNPLYKPPLTKHLFNPEYEDNRNPNDTWIKKCLDLYPLAAQVGDEYSEENALEKYLISLKQGNALEKNRYFETVKYIQHLFEEISIKYVTTNTGLPSNYLSMINIIAKSKYNNLVWINMNYDLFADYALDATCQERIKDINSYTNLQLQTGLLVKYIKPHGSVNWWRRNINQDQKTIMTIRDNIKRGVYPEGFESTYFSKDISIVLRKNIYGTTIPSNCIWFPALIAPIGEYSFICPEHVEKAIPDLKNTTDLLCIGFNALDKDILALIKENVFKISKLLLVNGGQDYAKAALKRLRDYNINILQDDNSVIYHHGFSDLVKKDLSNWLRT